MYPPVDEDVYAACLRSLGRDWTFSYLSKAGQRGKRLWPYTLTAYDRIRQEPKAMEILSRHGIHLEKPEPFHDGRNFMGTVERFAA